MTDTELVLVMNAGTLIVADVPRDARLWTAPGEADTEIRGLTFERTGKDDEILHLPLFRRKSRQL